MEDERLNKLEKQVAQLEKVINELSGKLEHLEKWNEPENIKPLSFDHKYEAMQSLPSNTNDNMLYLPEAKKRTLVEVAKIRKEITAEEVKKVTGRSLNLESAYLSDLYEKGYLERRRIGRRVYYKANQRIIGLFEEKD